MSVAEVGDMIMTTDTPLQKWLQLMRAEYTEIPGLHLTKAQVRRLWGLDPPTSEALLGALIQEHFLRETAKGTYVRADLDR